MPAQRSNSNGRPITLNEWPDHINAVYSGLKLARYVGDNEAADQFKKHAKALLGQYPKVVDAVIMNDDGDASRSRYKRRLRHRWFIHRRAINRGGGGLVGLFVIIGTQGWSWWFVVPIVLLTIYIIAEGISDATD